MMHKVQKISLYMSAASYQHATEQQRLAKNWAENTLPHILDGVLGQLADEHDWKYIDQLELEIPAAPWALSQSEWEQIFRKKLQILQVQDLTMGQVLGQFYTFLQKGYATNWQYFGNSAQYQAYFEQNLDNFIAELHEVLAKEQLNDQQLSRFFCLFPQQFYQNTFERLLKLPTAEAQIVLGKTLEIQKLRPKLLPRLLSELLHFSKTNKANTLDNFWIKFLSKNIAAEPQNLSDKKAVYQAESQPDVAEKYILAPNAGLVLLLPFYKNFFEALGLLENTFFMDENAQKLAAQALHFLATGALKATDDELLVPKILVAWPVEKPIIYDTTLPDYIQTEGLDLLQSVIQHWTQLSGSSIEALQTSFLQRAGRLQRHAEQFTFQIENSGIDVLLSGLPWGFRHYKLPWLEQSIVTDWY